MRGRSDPEAAALASFFGSVLCLAAGLYLPWSTFVAFAGGAVPLSNWDIRGGFTTGIVWVFVVDPVVVSMSLVLAYAITRPLVMMCTTIKRRTTATVAPDPWPASRPAARTGRAVTDTPSEALG
jgi:hypothetical protein